MIECDAWLNELGLHHNEDERYFSESRVRLSKSRIRHSGPKKWFNMFSVLFARSHEQHIEFGVRHSEV